jgi:hypothetical protein
VSVPALFGLSLIVGLRLPLTFDATLVVYYLLNLGYSFTLKRIVLLDVIVLAGLYTMRIMAGSASVNLWPSSWLLAFFDFPVPEPGAGQAHCRGARRQNLVESELGRGARFISVCRPRQGYKGENYAVPMG